MSHAGNWVDTANPIARSVASSDSSDQPIHSRCRAWGPTRDPRDPSSFRFTRIFSLPFRFPFSFSLISCFSRRGDFQSPLAAAFFSWRRQGPEALAFFIYFVLQWKCYIHNLCSHLIIFLLLHELYTQIFY